MAYTIDQLVLDIRSDLFDRPDVDDMGVARDTLWSDEDLLRYYDSAASRVASDTLGLRKLFTIAVTIGDPLVRLPMDEVLDILAAKFDSPVLGSRAYDLGVFNINEGIVSDDYGMVFLASPDLTRTGRPSHISRDYDNTRARLYPIPGASGVLSVWAIVVPPPIYPGMPIPFNSPKDRDLILMWMKKLAYEKQDADTLDLTRAQNFEAEYKRTVQDRASEIDRTRRDGGIIASRF